MIQFYPVTPPRRLASRLFLFLWLLILVARPAQAQVWQSAVKPGERGPASDADYAYLQKVGGVAVDAARNVYYTGAFSGTITLGTRTLTSAGSNDAYVAKFNSSGTCLWAVKVGGSGRESIGKPVIDASGNVYVGGSFASRFVMVGATRLDSMTVNHFIGKLNSSGAWQWAVRTGGAVKDLARDGSGNVYATGYFTASGGTFGATTLAPAIGCEVYVAKLNPAGVWQWAVRANNVYSNGPYSDYTSGRALTVDGSGNVYVTGSFSVGQLKFGTTTLSKTWGESEEMDMFVAKLSPAGVWQWANRVGYAYATSGEAIALDSSGNPYVTGFFEYGSNDFGPIHVVNANNPPAPGEATSDLFVAKLNPAGTWQWVTTAGGINHEQATDLAIDAGGNIFIAGTLNSTTVAFGPTVIANHDYGGRNASGSIGYAKTDLFVAKLNAAGVWQRAIGAGGTNSVDGGCSLALDGTSGGIYVTGAYSSTAAFGPLTLSHTPPTGTTTYGLFRARLLDQAAPLTFAPASGLTGTSVVITGAGFSGATAVAFNGVPATGFTVNSATQITATVPGAATTGAISVTTPGGTLISPGAFVVLPKITSFTPATAPVGATVTITGSGLMGAMQVWLGSPATAFTVVNGTIITATVPAGCTGTVSVATMGGTAVSTASFLGPPQPSACTPWSGTVGTAVVIAGCNFTPTTTVRFNGVPATTTFNSPTQLTAVVPAGAITGLVTVTNAAGSTPGPVFKVLMPPANDLCTAPNLPVLTCGVPVTGTIVDATTTGDPAGTCGTTVGTSGGVFYRFTGVGGPVTITTCGAATNFDTRLFIFTGTCGALTCVGGNDNATCSGQTQVSAVTFTTTLGTPYYVYVTGNMYYLAGAAYGSFVLTATAAQAPAISSFNPAKAMVGSSVVITGVRLTGATNLKFNGVAASGFTVNSATQITATVPAGATTGPVSVTTPYGPTTSASTFTVGPAITSLLPAQGTPGSIVLVQGSNFTSTTTVQINGLNATTTYQSPTQLSAVVPAGATTGRVTATNPVGTATSPANFTVSSGSPPTITSFSPSANVAVGTVVTITGANFTGATLVRFNNVNAAGLTVLSATQVRATVPVGATSGRVFVATPTGLAQSVAVLNIVPPPTLTALTPTQGAPGSVVVLTGTNLTGATSVQLAGTMAAFTVNSATQITATVPTGANSGPFSVTTVAGTATTPDNFTVNASLAPTITSLSVTSGIRGSSFLLTGTGLNGMSSSAIRIGAVTATFANTTTTGQYLVTVPATAVTGRIYVTTNGGMAQSPTDFTVILPPTITSFTPTTGNNTALVTVTGTNFTGTTSVTLNNQPLPAFSLVSATKLTFTPPAGSSSGLIQITNPAGTATSAAAFTYTGPRPAALVSAETASEAPAVVWTVFPNPAHGSVRIDAPAGTRLTLLDPVGRVVRVVSAADSETRLDITGLAPGLYTVRAGTSAQRLLVE